MLNGDGHLGRKDVVVFRMFVVVEDDEDARRSVDLGAGKARPGDSVAEPEFRWVSENAAKIELVKLIEAPGSRLDTTGIGTIFYAVGSTHGQKFVGIAGNRPAIIFSGSRSSTSSMLTLQGGSLVAL